MKTRLLLLLSVLLAVAAQSRPVAKPPVTTIYLVRHAEKDLAAGPNDPPLAPAGEERAHLLAQSLARRKPTALFTTDTRRARATLAPLAQATSLVPLVYDPKAPDALAARIYQEFLGRTVVVVGHSDTLLPLLAAFGIAAPVTEIKAEEYNYLFRVEMRKGEPSRLKVSRYGAAPPAGSPNKLR